MLNYNAVVLCAGEGSRFRPFYKEPKPLIDVCGKPMIQRVYESVGLDCPHTFIIRKDHNENNVFADTIKSFCKHANIIEVDHLTEGAACTTLLAKQHIDNEIPTVVYNADQIIEYDVAHFTKFAAEERLDGVILCFFRQNDPKWSYCQVDEYGAVVRVAEKEPISDLATVGVYYWRTGSLLVESIETMIEQNIRHNNEFYLAPSYNMLIENGGMVLPYLVSKMHGVGTPEQLKEYIDGKYAYSTDQG